MNKCTPQQPGPSAAALPDLGDDLPDLSNALQGVNLSLDFQKPIEALSRVSRLANQATLQDRRQKGLGSAQP